MSNGISISSLVNGNRAVQQQRSPSLDRPQSFTQFDREYYIWRNRPYPFPRDDDEADRLDIMHELIYQAALKDQLHTVQFQNNSERLQILDVGFGTGKWADDMAKKYPNAQITAIDIFPSQIPDPEPNLNTISPIDFTENQWGGLREGSIHFAHLAQLSGSVPDWQRLFGTVSRYLKPGEGLIETIEIDWTPRSHPAPFPEEGRAMQHWWEHMKIASKEAGIPVAYREDTEQLLENAGFVDISRKKICIPFYGNPRDPYEKSISDWYRIAMGHDESPERKNAFAGLSLMHLTAHFGWSESAVRELCSHVIRGVNKRGTPLYNYLYIWTARKPMR